jgi:rSAM/selenodomain-associated transferase 1
LKENALILFLKYPKRGEVKTRLAATLGDDFAYRLYQCFLADAATMTRHVNAQTVMVYSGPAGVTFPGFSGVPCLEQRGRNIGERMYFALLDVFALGFERCVLIGSDIPDLPAGMINDAFEILRSVDIVLGPGTDGGYYLMGCRQDTLRESVFAEIPWSTQAVFSETLKRIATAGLESAELQPWSDIDDLDDLKKFYERNNDPASTSQVIRFLKAKGIFHEP